jgi:hypothetical protein
MKSLIANSYFQPINIPANKNIIAVIILAKSNITLLLCKLEYKNFIVLIVLIQDFY